MHWGERPGVMAICCMSIQSTQAFAADERCKRLLGHPRAKIKTVVRAPLPGVQPDYKHGPEVASN